MKKTFKKQWVEALRSGKFRQGAGALYEDRTYCCLGVLCKVSGMDARSIRKVTDPDEDGTTNSTLGPELLKKFGLTDEEQCHLAEMNDDGKSFKVIADHIDATL